MPMLTVRRIVTTSTSTLYNLGTGTTSTNTSPFPTANKGIEVLVQNQSTGAVNVWFGDSTLAIAIGATSTAAGGSIIAQNGTLQLGATLLTGVMLDELYIASTSSQAICQVTLVRAV